MSDPEDRDSQETEGDLCASLGWEESGGGHGGWGDYCGWTLPSAGQVLQPILLRPGGGGYEGKLHGLAGSDVEKVRIVFADRSTLMASIVSLEPARVHAIGYVAFFEAGSIPRVIEGIGSSGTIIDDVQVPEGYADDPARSIPVSPSDP